MRRLYLTQRKYDALLKRQNGTCCAPWCDNTGELIADRSTPKALFPGKRDQLMCAPCHKIKKLREMKRSRGRSVIKLSGDVAIG